MEKNFDHISMQEAMRLANTDMGKQLMAMFQQQDSKQTQIVMDSVRSGDVEKARKALASFLADPKTQEVLQKLQEDSHERNGR